MKTLRVIIISASFLSLMACSKKEEAVKEESKNLELSSHTKSELSLAAASSEIVQNVLTLTGKVMPFEERQVKVRRNLPDSAGIELNNLAFSYPDQPSIDVY